MLIIFGVEGFDKPAMLRNLSTANLSAMAKNPNKPRIIKRFIEIYLNRLDKADPSKLLLSLIANGIVDPERLRNYMIVEDYYQNLVKHHGSVKESVLDTASTYEIGERQIQNIVYRWSQKFRPKRNIENPKEEILAESN